MPRRGAGRYFFALNRRSPLSPADAGPPRALSATRARAETARTTPEGPGACDRPRLSAFAAPSLGFLERAFSVAPHATAPLRAPASPALDVRDPRPSSTAPAHHPSRDEKVEGGHHARRAPCAASASTSSPAWVTTSTTSSRCAPRPRRTPPDPAPSLVASNASPAHPGRGRKIADSSTLRPPPSSPRAYSWQATQTASWGGDCPCSSTASARRTGARRLRPEVFCWRAPRRRRVLSSARAPFRGPFDYTCPTRSRALALR